MRTRDEFRAGLITFGERAVKVRDHLKNEEATKVALVLPFIALLGYDDRDPTEVAAEHAADFSEKYRNRVDYAILREMVPIIAIECKSLGLGKKDDRGQLKAYFNASKTVKLGVLTDGFLYECFVDSDEPNMMDDEPFLVLNLDDWARGQVSDTVLDGLFALTKGRFDPDTIAENARRSLTHKAFYDYLTQQFSDPSVELTRFLLKENNIKHVRAQAIDGYRAIAKAAFKDVFTTSVLRKLEINERSVPSASTAALICASAAVSPSLANSSDKSRTIETTQAEMDAFEAVRRRLAFLSAGDKILYDNIEKIKFRDYHGKMVIFFEMERKGRLLELIETKEGAMQYFVTDDGDKESVLDLPSVDGRLFELFRKRVHDLE